MSNELIKQYQETGDSKIGDQLFDLHKGYIQANINKWSGPLPQVVMDAYGKHYALNAFKSFDPNKGANINTHLYNHISQLSRLVYQHQNVSQIPENQVQQLGRVEQAKNHLIDEYGREPEVHEIADYMNVPTVHIERIMKNNRKDFLNDSDAETQQFAVQKDSKMSDRIFAIRNKLEPIQQKQFDALTGFGETKPLTPQEFGKVFKMKPYEVSRLKTSFAKRFK